MSAQKFMTQKEELLRCQSLYAEIFASQLLSRLSKYFVKVLFMVGVWSSISQDHILQTLARVRHH